MKLLRMQLELEISHARACTKSLKLALEKPGNTLTSVPDTAAETAVPQPLIFLALVPPHRTGTKEVEIHAHH